MAQRFSANGRVLVEAADYDRLEKSLAETLELAITLLNQVEAREMSAEDASVALRVAARMDK